MKTDRTLEAMSSGETALVLAVQGGLKVRARLESLGIMPGVQVDVLNNGRGPLIISLGEGRLMLERGVAGKVLVA
ncbi:FeoA family protein [Salidesulfovibrio brasiliensis]|uniref:FeoA family protein n=1 Tax=Salidesulfovibrio brasiliensis TaxID=221711 RepID=UPI0006D062B5|nr:FeoA family protein [Salidesulfovibrio brasiliensis]